MPICVKYQQHHTRFFPHKAKVINLTEFTSHVDCLGHGNLQLHVEQCLQCDYCDITGPLRENWPIGLQENINTLRKLAVG